MHTIKRLIKTQHIYLFTFVVGSNEAQDVLVAEHDGLVDFSFTKPGALLTRGEDLHGDVSSSPLPPPHLPKAAFTNDLLQHYGTSHCPLDKQRQTCRINERIRFKAEIKISET